MYMKWHKWFGNKRIQWLEKYVDKTSIAMSPSISEAVATWNLICEVILTTDLNSISDEESDIFIKCLQVCRHNPDEFDEPLCQIKPEFCCLKIVKEIHHSSPLSCWKLIEYMTSICRRSSSIRANYLNVYKYLEDMINECSTQDDKLFLIGQTALWLKKSLNLGCPSRICNGSNIAYLLLKEKREDCSFKFILSETNTKPTKSMLQHQKSMLQHQLTKT